MAVRILPPDEQRRRAAAIMAIESEWTAQQIAAGVDGPVPEDRMEGSDYNQHVPLMEADGAAMDDLFRRIGQATS
jgi:hypothetical protein